MWYLEKAATSHVLLEIKAVSFLAERPLRRALYIWGRHSITLPWNLTESSGEVIQESRVTALPLPLCPWRHHLHGGLPFDPASGEGRERALGFLPVLPRLGGVGGALNSSLPSSESICYQIKRRPPDSLLFSTLADLYAECKTDALCDTYLWWALLSQDLL